VKNIAKDLEQAGGKFTSQDRSRFKRHQYLTIQARNIAKPDLEQMELSLLRIYLEIPLLCMQVQLRRSRRKPLEAGAGPDSCHTAFAGIALECPVAKRYGQILPGRTQGGVTNI